MNLGAVFSLKLLGGKMTPKLVYFVLKKELLNVTENGTLGFDSGNELK